MALISDSTLPAELLLPSLLCFALGLRRLAVVLRGLVVEVVLRRFNAVLRFLGGVYACLLRTGFFGGRRRHSNTDFCAGAPESSCPTTGNGDGEE